jgi:hypothetical protein
LASSLATLPTDGGRTVGTRHAPGDGTVPPEVKNQAVTDVAAAAADGALPVGDDAGLPLHRFPLDRTADAQAAVERSAVGKVLIDVS